MSKKTTAKKTAAKTTAKKAVDRPAARKSKGFRELVLAHAADPALDVKTRPAAEGACEFETFAEGQVQVKTPRQPFGARSAIVTAALLAATDSAIRHRLKAEPGLAVIIIVPDDSWIVPVRKHIGTTWGSHWEIVLPPATPTPKLRTELDESVSGALAAGRCVVGIATALDQILSSLRSAVDITIRVMPPDQKTLRRAIRLFTGQRPDQAAHLEIGVGYHQLLACFRKGSTADEVARRIASAGAPKGADDMKVRLPDLATAYEYGAAREWGLALAQDIEDFRAGRIAWADIDRGAVLFSEPGLGKSMFARILARKCGVPLVAFSIADLFGSSPGYLDSVIKAARAKFAEAAALARPCCLMFIDELDALPNRATMTPRGAEWWTTVVTDFLLLLDAAVEGQRAGIIVVGATNNISAVDAALLRPGRLERAIEIKRPDKEGVINVLRHHLDGHLADIDLGDVADLLVGSTPAEIMMVVRGARRTARIAKRDLALDDLVQAVAPANDDVDAETLKRISIHEAAHAIGALVMESGELRRVTIASLGDSLGRTHVEADQILPTRDFIERRCIVTLAGRAAEALLLGDVSLGGGGDKESDLANVTRLLATIHGSTGLGDRLIYLTSHDDALGAVRADAALRATVEVHMQALQRRAEEVVRDNRDAIVSLAAELRERRTMSGDEIRQLYEASRKPPPIPVTWVRADPADPSLPVGAAAELAPGPRLPKATKSNP